MLLRLWPQSLFGRLIAASVVAVLIAQAAALVLIAQERERFVLQISAREWAREIADTTRLLAPLSQPARATALAGLSTPRGLPPPRPRRERRALSPRAFVRVPLLSDFEAVLKRELRSALGPGYAVTVAPTPDPERPAVPVAGPFYEAREVATHPDAVLRYDVTVRLPDGDAALFRVTRMPHGAPLPRNLYLNLAVLVLILVIALYVTARNVTRPLSALARAADRMGRGDTRPSMLEERGARELRNAARAFNTMQDRLHRYLDSRTRVLAAMSHDLKTPLTRLRLQVETLENPPLQARIGKELDEMESMVREALALFRGPDDTEPESSVDVNALLANLAAEFAEMGGEVTVEGRALEPYAGKARLLKRCLRNLLDNAITFGTRAHSLIEDGGKLTIRVRDEGCGIPEAELERVFEPFYRRESSRNRASGGTGLGLSIARDIAEAHGGTLSLANRLEGGLEATLVLPRRR